MKYFAILFIDTFFSRSMHELVAMIPNIDLTALMMGSFLAQNHRSAIELIELE